MKILLIGGDRHGEWVETLDDSQVWLDIRNAVTHRIRKVTYGIQDIKTGAVLEAYVVSVAVHESLLGPDEVAICTQLLNLLAMNEFARAHGVGQEIPKEPAGSSLIVPGGAQ